MGSAASEAAFGDVHPWRRLASWAAEGDVSEQPSAERSNRAPWEWEGTRGPGQETVAVGQWMCPSHHEHKQEYFLYTGVSFR